MQFKSYGKKATMPQRMARKRSRREVFISNKRAGKLRRKEARLSRKTQLEAAAE